METEISNWLLGLYMILVIVGMLIWIRLVRFVVKHKNKGKTMNSAKIRKLMEYIGCMLAYVLVIVISYKYLLPFNSAIYMLFIGFGHLVLGLKFAYSPNLPTLLKVGVVLAAIGFVFLTLLAAAITIWGV